MKKQESDQGAPPAQSKLIIDRARWVRGNCDKSALLRSDGKMCCLGFFGRACGLPPDAILEKPSPDAVDGYTDHWPSWLLQYVDERGYHRDTAECSALIVTNDSSILTEPDREREIAALFAKHGVTVEFTGDAAEPPNE